MLAQNHCHYKHIIQTIKDEIRFINISRYFLDIAYIMKCNFSADLCNLYWISFVVCHQPCTEVYALSSIFYFHHIDSLSQLSTCMGTDIRGYIHGTQYWCWNSSPLLVHPTKPLSRNVDFANMVNFHNLIET